MKKSDESGGMSNAHVPSSVHCNAYPTEGLGPCIRLNFSPIAVQLS